MGSQTQVVIAGGGIAGIVTAIELLEAGCKVILLDRDEKDRFGGLARWSFGGMFFVDSPKQRKAKIKDSPELALRDWKSFAEFGPNDHYPMLAAEAYVNECTEVVYNWLTGHGIKYFPVVHWVERGLLKPGNSVPRFHMVWGTGWELTEVLIRVLKNHKNKGNLEIRFRHKVEEILGGPQGATGVRGVDEAANQPFEIQAEHVVVAAGGICGNIERLKKEWYKDWGTPPEKILNGSHQYATGELHDAVATLNGNVTHLDKQWNYAAGVHHPRPKQPNHGLSIVPPKSALWLNYRGERIGPMPLVSAYDTRFLVEQICKEEKKYSWQVMNQKIALKELAVSGSEFNDAIRNKKLLGFLKVILFGNKHLVNTLVNECEDFVVANSINELADKMNTLTGTKDVDAKALGESIGRYDAVIDRGVKYHNDEQLRRIAALRQYRGDRVRTCKFQKINDKGAMPFIAIREFILSRKSLGGIQTDLKGRVLTQPDTAGKQEPIRGLYAVGEAAGFGGGGAHGLRALEGTFLGGCVFTARKAAQTIAGEK